MRGLSIIKALTQKASISNIVLCGILSKMTKKGKNIFCAVDLGLQTAISIIENMLKIYAV